MSPEDIGFVLPVDKEVGPTSHDVVHRARRALGVRRIGHTGTLDPFASGLLLLCVGRTTRIAEYLTGLDKRYEATARLGARTTTDDLEGEVIGGSEAWRSLDPGSVTGALAAFVGPLDQIPPQFSAKKVGGEAMHRRARRGEHVTLEPSHVRVHEIEVLEIDLPLVRFSVRCSSGTYIRSLARDLGDALEVGGHLTALRRTGVGRFDVSGAARMDELEDAAAVERVVLTPLQALAHLPVVEVDATLAARLAQGQRVACADAPESGPLAVVTDGALVAIAGAEDGLLKPTKVLA